MLPINKITWKSLLDSVARGHSGLRLPHCSFIFYLVVRQSDVCGGHCNTSELTIKNETRSLIGYCDYSFITGYSLNREKLVDVLIITKTNPASHRIPCRGYRKWTH